MRLAFQVLMFMLLGASVSATEMDTAVLQGLDKVTARISTIEAPIGQLVNFRNLEIIARHCDKRPPEETPESSAFMDIWEIREGEPTKGLFRGWMFASSPALNGMEHPVYDVWLLDCRNRSSNAPVSLPESGAASN
ncbi:DUF2155 domain-containing protein [Magnetospira sp. QH-2]|uniref:DUF2155 domain-containing protein n=1 Tax=Magnetospira sp. (strain QH-2) TaxID=1288970 RepID=UPI0003E818D0|nr:DUF2155 domain-containing protein [Magnetospira sp. QH-2]CCQ73705.1 Conserved exported protein of unknown function [Magnetospira sp. QH-2]